MDGVGTSLTASNSYFENSAFSFFFAGADFTGCDFFDFGGNMIGGSKINGGVNFTDCNIFGQGGRVVVADLDGGISFVNCTVYGEIRQLVNASIGSAPYTVDVSIENSLISTIENSIEVDRSINIIIENSTVVSRDSNFVVRSEAEVTIVNSILASFGEGGKIHEYNVNYKPSPEWSDTGIVTSYCNFYAANNWEADTSDWQYAKPDFLSIADDLHINNSLLFEVGDPAQNGTIDLDGDVRDMSPSIGGDQVNSPITGLAIKESSFNIWPNPASTSFEVNLPPDTEFEVFNVFGKLTTSGNTASSSRINCKDWPAGIYFVKTFESTAKLMIVR